MKLMTRFLLSSALLFCLSCEKQTTESKPILSIEDLLVKNNEITGWTYARAGWVANNLSELTTQIDGLADVFQRHGFIEAAHQDYQGKIDNGDRQLKLTVYSQGTEANARATYQDADLGFSGALEWTTGAGQTAHYIRYGGLSQVLAFYRRSYYVALEINYDTEESLNILKQFALNVDGKLK